MNSEIYASHCRDGFNGGDGYLLAADLLRAEGKNNEAALLEALHRWVKGGRKDWTEVDTAIDEVIKNR